LATVFEAIALQIFGPDVSRFPLGAFPDRMIQVGGASASLLQLCIIGISVVLMALLTFLLARTRLGRQLRAVAESARAARILGVNVDRTIALAFFLSSALGGAAGVLFGLAFNSISPDVGRSVELKGLAVIILGGMGSVPGALITLHAPGVPFIAVLAASAIVPAVVAVPLGLPVLRLRGVFLAIATVGFGEVVRLFFVNWDYTNGALGLVAIPQRTHLWTVALALALALYFFGRLHGSRTGYALEAIREDETAARTMGIYTTGHKLAMLVVGAALAGLAGGLEAHFTFMVAPGGYGFGRVVEMLVQAVVGGT